VPILMGPHYENFCEIVEKLLQQNAIQIADQQAFSDVLMNLLRSPLVSTAMGDRGRAVFDSESGATSRAVEVLLALLPEEHS
jgi:3-deoxy-D-manno-octulosonic-acid transferase